MVAPVSAPWPVRDELVPRLEWKTTMSATASAAHASTTTTSQRGRRVAGAPSEGVGWAGGNASTAMGSSGSATVASTPRSGGLGELPASGTNATAAAEMISDSSQPGACRWPSVSTSTQRPPVASTRGNAARTSVSRSARNSSTASGWSALSRCGLTTGMSVPGIRRPCLAGEASATAGNSVRSTPARRAPRTGPQRASCRNSRRSHRPEHRRARA